jgi:serine/threonine protein kinase
VYACSPHFDPKLELAVKVLSLKSENINDLNNEVRLLSSVRSPYIVQLVETFMDAESFYLVMERLRGGELIEALGNVGVYTESHGRNAFRQIMEALHILQHHHIVHRDLV